MPRKSIVNELQAEEAVANSPRRSSRIVNGNGTPAGVTTRRASQTTESDTPARATRGRRTSTQAPEEKVEPKTVTRSRRASVTAEEDSQKETLVPARRGRKPSVTTEPTVPEELENPKPVRGRRASRANSEDNEEENPQKTAPIRGKRSTASIELEAEVKIVQKAPAKPVTRRRSSATEPIVNEEVSTPAKRTTRGRKASDTDEVFEETKKPVTRGRRKSINPEEETKEEEIIKPITRRSRRASTDEVTVVTVPKTPGRSTRRSSVSKEAEILEEEQKDTPVKTEENVSPLMLNDLAIKLTPLKKRKIVEKVEAELDLSIINESSDDVNSSKQEESLKESPVKSLINSSVKYLDGKLVNEETTNSDDVNSSKHEESLKNSPVKSLINSSVKSLDGKFVNEEIIQTEKNKETATKDLPLSSGSTDISPSSKVSPNSRKRLNVESETSPRKSPRLTEKLLSNTPQKESKNVELSPSITQTLLKNNTPQKVLKPTPKKFRNVLKQDSQEIIEKTHSFVSSGSDDSFKLHLSTVSMTDSVRFHQDDPQEDVFNTSNESSGSNKENIELTDSTVKDTYEKTIVIPIQEPIVVARVSNVFKPNQKEYSFMEPMEVDESVLMADNSVMDKSVALDESSVIFNRNIRKSIAENKADSSSDNINNTLSESVEFSKKISDVVTNQSSEKDHENTAEIMKQQLLTEVLHKSSYTETEGSDNLLIEESEKTLDISIKSRKSENAISVSPDTRRSKSPKNRDASLVINATVEKVKVVLSRKSSSPLNIRRSSRRSKSPLPDSESSDSDNEAQNNLRVSKPKRKSKSKTPSPIKCVKDNLQVLPRKSKSKSPSPRRLSEIKKEDVNQAAKSENDVDVAVDAKNSASPCKSKSPTRFSKSPVDRDNSTLSSNKATRSKSTSPLQQANRTPQIKELQGSLNASNQNEPPDLNQAILGSREAEKVHLGTSNDVESSHEARFEQEPTETSIVEQQTMNQDKTEYHTALATTNTDSEFNSISNNDNDITHSELKLSESTHYDFDLPSDDDDLLDPKDNTRTSTNNSFNEAVEQADKVESIEVSKLAEHSKEKIEQPCSEIVCDLDSEIHKEQKSGDTYMKRNETDSGTVEINNSPKEKSVDDNVKSGVEQIVTGEKEKEEIKTKDAENVIQENNESSNNSEKELDTSKISEDKNTESDGDKMKQVNEIEPCSEEISPENVADSIDISSKDVDASLKENKVAVETDLIEIVSSPKEISAKKNLELNFTSNHSKSDLVVADESTESVKPDNLKLENDLSNESHVELIANSSENKICEDVVDNEDSKFDSKIQKENGKLDETLDESKLENDLTNKSPMKLNTSRFETNESDDIVENKSGENGKTKSVEEIVGRKSEENFVQKENKELDETLEDVSTCKMAQKVDKVKSPKKLSKDNSPKPMKSRSSLDEFATAKLSEYIKSKVSEIEDEEPSSEDEDEADEEESESEQEYNEFIDGMAEEGEEDTPSEDSNQIIDEGESIGSSDSEVESDGDYDENDSFICDEEDHELLSGEEYDLDSEKKKKSKKTRIIDISTLDDDEIIKVPNKKTDKEKPKKKSRIIKVSDSSSDEEIKFVHMEVKSETGISKSAVERDQSPDGSVIVVDVVGDSKVDLIQNAHIEDNPKIVEIGKENSSSVIIIEDSKVELSNNESILKNISRNSLNSSSLQKRTEENSNIISIDDSKEEAVSDNKSFHQNVSLSSLNTSPQKKTVDSEREEVSNNESIFHNISLSALNTSLQKKNRRSSLSIHENIVVDGIKDLTVSKRINTLVETFCSTVKKGEIALNLSLEYEDLPESSAKETDMAENIHILSNVRYCPRAEPNSDQDSSKDAESEKELNISDEPVQDLRQVLNKKKLKRRLSKSLSEVYEEQKEAKRRKKHKKMKQATSEEKMFEKSGKQKRRLRPDLSEKLGSFSLMNQLITDVKNRPRRALKPTKTDSEADNSWTTTKISNLKPSTTPVTKEEIIKPTPKLHPKDFKNMLLSDPKRVKRIETKTLLKKRGANL